MTVTPALKRRENSPLTLSEQCYVATGWIAIPTETGTLVRLYGSAAAAIWIEKANAPIVV